MLTQRLVEAEETLKPHSTKANEDLRIIHEEFGKLLTSTEKENKQNTALRARFTDLERVQPGMLESLTFEAVMLAKKRDTANGLLKYQILSVAKKRTSAARENYALNRH